MIDWLRRLLGLGRPTAPTAPSGRVETVDAPTIEQSDDGPPPEPLQAAEGAEIASAAPACPSCAALLDPPPTRTRRCPYCREVVVVRRVDGRTLFFTEQAVAVFEAQRQRELDDARWTAERVQWLLLARGVGASQDRRTRLAEMPIAADVVAASRRLYTTTATRRITVARRERRWGDVGQLARDEALALYRDAGSPKPVPDEFLLLYREGMTAVLRSLIPIAKDVELVSAGCCAACRHDEGQTFRTSDEAKGMRLPHPDCPRGLCGCDWWPAVVDRRRRRKRRAAANVVDTPTLVTDEIEPVNDADVEAAGEPLR